MLGKREKSRVGQKCCTLHNHNALLCLLHVFGTKSLLYSHSCLVCDFSIGSLLIGFGSGVCDVMKTTIVCLESQGFDRRVLMHKAG